MPVLLDNLPPTLQSLDAQHHIRECARFNFAAATPNLLTALVLSGACSTSLISLMSQSLTALEIRVRRPEHWNLLATRLLALRKFTIGLDQRWSCSSDLAPIQSPHITSFHIISKNRLAIDQSTPFVAEFFSPTSSPLPSSITEVSHQGEAIIHTSILTVLPPNLRSLHLDGLTWGALQYPTDKILLPFPEGAGLSAAELFQRLPRTLRKISLKVHRNCPNKYQDRLTLATFAHKLSSFEAESLFNSRVSHSRLTRSVNMSCPCRWPRSIWVVRFRVTSRNSMALNVHEQYTNPHYKNLRITLSLEIQSKSGIGRHGRETK